MTDRRREEQIHPSRSAYMHYIHTTEMARRHERQIQLAQLDEEIRRDEAMMMKKVHDSRIKTEKAIQEIRLEQERRLIKEEQKRQEHEERRRARRLNREELERELARIKDELRAQLAKEDIKRQKAEQESVQHKEEEQKRLRVTQEKQVCLKQIKGRQPAVELKSQEQKQRIKDNQSTATGQEKERIQEETKEKGQRRHAERENEHKTCMEQNEASSEELRGTEVQTNYNENKAFTEEKKISDEKRETEVHTSSRKKSHEDAMSSDDTSQKDCTSCSIPHDQLNISCEKMSTLDVLYNTDRQEMCVDQTLGVCIAQECVSGDIVQSEHAHVNLSDEPLQVFETKNINLEVHHVTDLQEKVMQHSLQKYIAQECASEVQQSMIQLGILNVDSEVREITMYAESRDIVMICKNSCLCFKFLWWQEGTLSS